MPYNITVHHVIWCRLSFYHIASYRISSFHVISYSIPFHSTLFGDVCSYLYKHFAILSMCYMFKQSVYIFRALI